MPLLKHARTSAVLSLKASLKATSSSVRGTALASPFEMVMWLMVPPCILSRVWRLGYKTVRLSCGNPIAEFKRHIRFRLRKSRRRKQEQRADKHSPKTLESTLSANGRNFNDSTQDKNTCGWRRPAGDPGD